MMSAGNYPECLIGVLDRAPAAAKTLELALAEFALEMVPEDRALVSDAAQARLRYPIDSGDCLACALATARGMPLLTLNADFSQTDVELVELT